uniref:Uncharacterized protein n=1 Tax=Amphilophus citrinellus TaxID=61819 RepID=A0A3Q0RL67_AMPCI
MGGGAPAGMLAQGAKQAKTATAYGSKKLTVHEIHTCFKATSCQFSEAMLHSGMFRNHGFNMSVDGSTVMVSIETQHRRANFHHLYHYGNHSSEHDGSSK